MERERMVGCQMSHRVASAQLPNRNLRSSHLGEPLLQELGTYR